MDICFEVPEDTMDVCRCDLEATTSEKSVCFLTQLPVEIIETILSFSGRSKDILNFALTSRACYNTALALIYQNVDWTIGPSHERLREAALRGTMFLRTHPELLAVTRYLRVSEKVFDRGGDTKLFLGHSCNEAPIQPTKKVRSWQNAPAESLNHKFPQTFHATNVVLEILPRFSGLVELTLRSITLPRTFYQNIHSLSDLQLRRLTIRCCRLSTRYPKGYDPATLQLTELSIFSMHSKVKKLRALLKLTHSPMLRVLRMDRSVERALGSLVAYGLPPSVHSLELDWRGNAHPRAQSHALLFFFLNSCCKFVRHLELTDVGKLDNFDAYPANKRLKPSALPSLTSVTVPVPYLELLLTGRAVDNVTITDTTVKDVSSASPMLKFLTVEAISEVLKILQHASISLRSFKVNLRTWDKELFYMLARRQKSLRELHVAYQYGEVDDAFYMTLGNLIEFPHLECLHLYRFGDKMAGTEDERFIDQKEYMIIWQLYMPNLREVALSSDIVWTRSTAIFHKSDTHRTKQSWSRYAVEPMDGVEGLIIVTCPKEARRYEAACADRQRYRQHHRFPNFHIHPPPNLHLMEQNANLNIAEQNVIVEDLVDLGDEQDFH